jgi:hypothetical protein
VDGGNLHQHRKNGRGRRREREGFEEPIDGERRIEGHEGEQKTRQLFEIFSEKEVLCGETQTKDVAFDKLSSRLNISGSEQSGFK